MKNVKSLALLCCTLFLLGACTSTAKDKSGDVIAQAGSSQINGTTVKHSGSAPADVQKSLDETAVKLAGMADRTVVPNKKNPKIRKVGKEYVASYLAVDMQTIRTTVRPGQTASAPYVGIIEYIENGYECRGATRAAAKASTDCKTTSTRGVKELISYNGKKWMY